MAQLTEPLPLPGELLRALSEERPKAAPKSSGPVVAASGSLVSLIQEDGHQLEKKGALEEYCGPCPWCGGRDRFVVGWDGEGRDGRERYYCRQCSRKGDAVSWLIDRKGLHPVAAKDARGVPVPDEYRPIPARLGSAAPELPDDAHPWDACCHTLESFTATPPPPTKLLIAGLLEAACLAVVSGRPGSLKTMLMMWLLIHVAIGREVLGRRVEQANIGIIDVDNGQRRDHRRMYALARPLGITSAPLKTYVFPKINLSSPESVALVESLIRREKFGALLIDTFVHASGVDDENDSAKLTEPLYALRRIVDTTGCAIILIHHPSKAGSPLRGSSAIEGAVDLGLIVERPDKSKPLINVSTFKTRDAVVEPFSLNWHFETDQTGELVGGSFTEVEKDEETLNALHHRLIEELAEGGAGGLNALTRRLHCNKNALATLLARLVPVGAVTVTPGPRGGKTYGLSSGK